MHLPYADLHLHSYYSDGTLSPLQIAQTAKAKGFGVISVCDHECLDAYPELITACEQVGIRCICGVELTCHFDGVIYHVLGYGYDCSNEPLRALCAENRRLLLKMGDDLIAQMESDYPTLSLAEHKAYEYDRTQGGWKTLYYLMEKGITHNKMDAMPFYAQYGCSYLAAGFPALDVVCATIRGAGGYPILAHCGDSVPHHGDLEKLEQTLLTLLENGITGLECFYPSHTAPITRLCLELCQRRHLNITSGSDSHGEFQKWVGDVPFAIGAIKTPVELLRLGDLLPNVDESLSTVSPMRPPAKR